MVDCRRMATPNSNPRFRRVDRSVVRRPGRPSLQQPQQNLFERVASAAEKVAGLRAKLGAAEQQVADLHAKMEANRGPALLIAGMAVAIVALSLWSAETQREMARLRVAGDASELLIAKLREELVTVRQTIGAARLAPLPEESGWTSDRMADALGSPADADKIASPAAAETTEPRGDYSPVGKDLLWTRESVGDSRLRADKKRGEGIMDVPKIEEILTAAQVLSGPVISDSGAFDGVSSDDLLLAPDRHVGREVVVTGSVMWLLRRYWLQSDNGRMKMLIDIQGLRSDERAGLRDAVARIEFLARARARITGTVERQGGEGYRLAATKLTFVR